MSSTSILMVKRIYRRNRGMESIRDIEDDTGLVLSALDLLELLLIVPSTVFRLQTNCYNQFHLEVLKSLN